MAVAHRIYAKAVFEAAKQKAVLARVGEDFASFADAVQSSPELRNLLQNPQVDARAKQAALGAALAEADPTLRNFVLLLTEKGRAGEVSEIHEEFERLVAQEDRVIQVELTTAHELSDTEASDILQQIEQTAGHKIEATRTVDPSLIGGLVLRAGSILVDSSVRGRLDKLREELVSR
ncbi:MAG: ATP synthase F1 subunit delta [Gaiellaceae bacterium]